MNSSTNSREKTVHHYFKTWQPDDQELPLLERINSLLLQALEITNSQQLRLKPTSLPAAKQPQLRELLESRNTNNEQETSGNLYIGRMSPNLRYLVLHYLFCMWVIKIM